MKQVKRFCKRVLPVLLSLAMVFTSFNMPAASIQAHAAVTGLVWSETGTGVNVTTTANYAAHDIYVDGEIEYEKETTPQMYSIPLETGEHVIEVVAFTGAAPDWVEADRESKTVTIGGTVAAPSAPAGVEGGYWSTEDDNYGKIRVAWGAATGTVENYVAYIDDAKVGESATPTALFVENTYAAGLHTIKVEAVNSAGSTAGTATFTLTEDQAGNTAGGTDPNPGEGEIDPNPGEGGDVTPPAVDPAAINFEELAAENIETFFSTSNGWGSATGTFTPDGTSLTLNATNAGNQGDLWEIQYKAKAGSLVANEQSVVSFDVVSSQTKNGVFKLTTTDEGWAFCNKNFTAGTTSKRVSALVVADSNIDTKFVWGLGASGETSAPFEMTISNAKIVPASTVADTTDKADLQALYTAEKAIVDAGNTGDVVYTEDTWNAYAAAVTAAGTVLTSETATLLDVFTAYDNIETAKKALKDVEKVDVDLGDYVNLEEKSNVLHNGTSATITPDGASVVIESADGAWGNIWDWAIQYWIGGLEVTAGNWVVEYDIVSTVDKPVYFKVTTVGGANDDTPIVEKGHFSDDTKFWNLTANKKEHYKETITVDAAGNIRLFYNLASGSAPGKVTISNVKLSQPSEFIDLEEKQAEENGLWDAIDGANSNVTYTVDGTAATFTGSTWGNSNWWSVQWSVQNLAVTAGKWDVEFDIESTIADKPVYFKLTNSGSGDVDTPIIEKGNVDSQSWKLNANEKEHYKGTATIAADGKVRFFFNLAGAGSTTDEGTITISNMKLSKTPLVEAPTLSTEKVTKTNGFKVGESVVLNFTDNEDWRNSIASVKVANKTVEAEKYSFAEGTLTLDSSLFTKQNIYNIEVDADGYTTTSYTVAVYDASVANEDWKLEWSDEFNGTELDTTKWDYEIGIQSGTDGASDAPTYWGNNEKQYYIKEAITFEDGKMVITGDKLTDEIKEKYGVTDTTVQYTSARIRTVSEDGANTKFATTYGRIEASMELPEANGYWPAFWMLPTNETIDTYGTWAASGEIDIMEAVGQNNNYVNGTIHYGGQWPNNTYSGGSYYFPEGQSTGGSHVYAIEWEPGEMRWYVDDVLYHVENNWYAVAPGASENYAFPAPFDEDFYILFNLAMSGNYVGNEMPTDMGKSLKVDYVRVYKDASEDYDKVVEAPAEIEKDSEFFETQTGNATADGNYIKDQTFTIPADHIIDAGSVAIGNDLVPNPGEWYLVVTPAGDNVEVSTVDVDGTTFGKFNVKSTATYIQLLNHVPLAKGYTYKLSFDAYTDNAPRSMAVAIKGDADNGWTGYGGGVQANLTSSVQHFETEPFTMAKDSDATARIEFDLNTAGTVYISNVKFVALTDEELDELEQEKLNGPKEPLENGEHIYNGTFDQGTGKFVYWTKDGDYTVDTSNRTMKATINASSDIDDVTLSQPGLQLLAGDSYELTFDAKADSEKEIKVGLYSKDGKIYAETVKTINAETSQVKYSFKMPADVTDKDAVLIIAFGGNTIGVEIDNVSMFRLSNENVEWNADLIYPLGNSSELWHTYNYLADPDHGGTVANGETVPENGEVTVATKPADSADNAWYYMVAVPVTLKAGNTYRLSYDVKSTAANQKLNVNVQEDVNYASTFAETVTVSTDWLTVTDKEFKASINGSAFIKFMMADPGNVESNFTFRNVKLTCVEAPYIVIDEKPSQMKVGTTYQLGVRPATEVNAKYDVYTFESTNQEVATVSNSGLVTAVSAGTTTIKITSAAGAKTSFDIEVATDGAEITNADTTALVAKVAEAEEYLAEADKYTVVSVADLTAAVDAAKAIIAGVEAGSVYAQATVDAAVAAITNAISALVKIEDIVNADTTALAEKVAQAEKYLAEADKYSEASIANLAAAVDAAKAIISGVAAGTVYSQKAVDNAVAAIDTAINGLDRIVKDGLWMEEVEPQTYTGKAIKPEVVVYDGETLLVAKKDYTVSYSNNVKVGENAVIKVKGKGNYTGTIEETFVIEPKDLASEDIVIANVYANIKNNAVKNPKVVVKDGKKTLAMSTATKTKDYTFTWPELEKDADGNIIAKPYTIEVTGQGNYSGTTTFEYDVRTETILMSKVKVTVSGNNVPYDGENTKKPQLIVTYGSGKNKVTLVENVDYEAEWFNTDVVGKNKAYVVLTAVEGTRYYGSKTQKYTVVGRTLSSSTITVSGVNAGYAYTGQEVNILDIDYIEIIDKKNKNEYNWNYRLQEGVDFDVEYQKNVDAGNKATMIITGKGLYAGTLKKTFKITALDLNDCVKSGSLLYYFAPEAEYNKNGATPEYFMAFDKNGNGSVDEGETLELKKDYTVTYKNNKKAGNTATMTIKGKGNFKGTLPVISYTVKANAEVDAANVVTITADDLFINNKTKADKLKTKLTLVEVATGKKLSGSDYDTKATYFVYDETGAERALTADDLKADNVIYARVTLKGNYAGTLTTSFRLYTTKVSSLKIAAIPAQYYVDGVPSEPEVTVQVKVKEGNKSVWKNLDQIDATTGLANYEISYSKNDKVGTAKVTVTGVGNGYGGTKSASFKIKAQTMDWADWYDDITAKFFGLFN